MGIELHNVDDFRTHNPPDNLPITYRQLADKSPVRSPDKVLVETHALQYIQPISTTGMIKYGNKIIRNGGNLC